MLLLYLPYIYIYHRKADSPQQGLSHRGAHLPHRDGRGTLIIMYCMYVCMCVCY